MTARSSFDSSVVSANTTLVASNQSAANTAQETVNVTGVNANANPQRGASDAVMTATKNANIAYQVAKFNASQAHQAAVAVAKSTLRATGDVNPI